MSSNKIFLAEDKHGGELFLDALLREVQNIPTGSDLVLDISKFSWANDMQLSTLPFVISHLNKKLAVNTTVVYQFATLFENDPFFEHLYSTGFFDLLLSQKVIVARGSPLMDGLILRGPFSEFLSFKNIADTADEKADESANFLYYLSGLLRSIFQDEIFENTSTADKIARVIAKELIENINLHSQADLAIVRFNYLRDHAELLAFQKSYGGIPIIRPFCQNNMDSPIFIITIADNGKGIISTLRDKYKRGDFIPKAGESLGDMLCKTNSWWLKKAFDTHLSSKDAVRTRLGLRDIIDTVSENNGFLFLRCEDSSVHYNKYNGNITNLEDSLYHPNISGTHYFIAFPASVRKKIFLNDIAFESRTKEVPGKERSDIGYVDFDMSYHLNEKAISNSTEVSYNHPKKMIDVLSAKLESDIFGQKRLLVLDFSNAIHEKANNYSYILEQLVEKYGPRFAQHCIVRNATNDVIQKLANSNLSVALNSNKAFLCCFNILDRFSLLGIADPTVSKDLLLLYKNVMLNIKNINSKTLDIINNNNFIVKIATRNDNKEVYAYFIDFSYIFRTAFEEKIEVERIKSGALLEGHYSIRSNLHVDNYLNAPLMFQNPSICRLYAKEICKKLDQTKMPDILLTYSTTGIIMYYYLKNHYYHKLKLMLINNPTDLSCRYGEEITQSQKVLILTDIKATGDLLSKLRRKAIELSGSDENIVGEVAVFDLNDQYKVNSDRYFSLHDGIRVSHKPADQCACKEQSEFVLNIEPATGAPNIYQKKYSSLSVLLAKKRLMKTIKEISGVKHEEILSRIDDIKVSEFELYKHWESLDKCFKLGHRQRLDTHFEHYDIPEVLLFNSYTLLRLESYIKKFVWKFTEHIHFVIYPRDLTAAFLSHIVASRFLKKPIVAEARKLDDGTFVLPTNIASKLRNKHVLLVDDAINTGRSMVELVSLISIYGGKTSGIFTITNRAHPETEMELRTLVPRVACAYKFNLNIYRRSQCDLCNQEQNIEFKLKSSATKDYSEFLMKQLEAIKCKDYLDK